MKGISFFNGLLETISVVSKDLSKNNAKLNLNAETTELSQNSHRPTMAEPIPSDEKQQNMNRDPFHDKNSDYCQREKNQKQRLTQKDSPTWKEKAIKEQNWIVEDAYNHALHEHFGLQTMFNPKYSNTIQLKVGRTIASLTF